MTHSWWAESMLMTSKTVWRSQSIRWNRGTLTRTAAGNAWWSILRSIRSRDSVWRIFRPGWSLPACWCSICWRHRRQSFRTSHILPLIWRAASCSLTVPRGAISSWRKPSVKNRSAALCCGCLTRQRRRWAPGSFGQISNSRWSAWRTSTTGWTRSNSSAKIPCRETRSGSTWIQFMTWSVCSGAWVINLLIRGIWSRLPILWRCFRTSKRF